MGAMHTPVLVSVATRQDVRELLLHVIYTAAEETRASMSVAERLARDLGARLVLVAPHVVPYPAALDRPTVPVRFVESKLGELAGGHDVDVAVTVLLCRDREESVRRRLSPESIVVIGTRRRWGPGSFRRLIRLLRRDGHHVITVRADECLRRADVPANVE